VGRNFSPILHQFWKQGPTLQNRRTDLASVGSILSTSQPLTENSMTIEIKYSWALRNKTLVTKIKKACAKIAATNSNKLPLVMLPTARQNHHKGVIPAILQPHSTDCRPPIEEACLVSLFFYIKEKTSNYRYKLAKRSTVFPFPRIALSTKYRTVQSCWCSLRAACVFNKFGVCDPWPGYSNSFIRRGLAEKVPLSFSLF